MNADGAMRVGLVIYGPLDGRSGGYLYDAQLVQHLREAGDEVRVFSQPEASYAGRLRENLHRGFWRELARADLDALLQDELNHPSLALGNRWLRRRVDYPIVGIVHHLYADEWPRSFRQRAIERLERAFLATTDAWIANSRATLERVRGLGLERPSVVAYPGGDRFGGLPTGPEIERRAHQPGPLRVLFLGHVVPRKRLALVLEAVAATSPETCTLSVAGGLDADPAYAARMRRRVEERGIADRVRFCGRVADDELVELLRTHQVMALPSAHEGFGMAYLESLGFGLAVCAPASSPAAELIDDGASGFLIDNARPDELATRFETLHEHRDLLARVGCDGRRAFDAHPTWAETGATVRAFLLELVGDDHA